MESVQRASMDRLKQLKQFVKEEPNDPFNLYALALEYLKVDPLESDKLFERLLADHPGYLPTYYPYAQRLVERKMSDQAEAVFKKGMSTARGANDNKTFGEIQAAYNDWKFEFGS